MKTMKKLHVAVAAASLFVAAGSSMAASINQSGLTIAREAISANTASTQAVRAPTATYNFDNGPAANASSTQDFNVTLTLGGSGDAKWDAAIVPASAYKTIAALRRNNGNSIVEVLPASAGGGITGKVYLLLMDVDVVPAGTLGNQTGDTITAGKTLRYKFRLVNNTASTVGIGDLQLNFFGQNPGASTVADFQTGFTFVAPVAADYQKITNLASAANATTVTTGAGSTGDTDGNCGEPLRSISLTARNYNGSGDGVQGESAGASASSITNQGYIQFQTALRVIMEKGIAVDRNTDPLNGNALLVLNGAAGTGSMALGTIQFKNRNLNAWDVSTDTAYYQYGTADLNNTVVSNGEVDVSGLKVDVTATNGFAAGTQFRLSNNPSCVDTAAPIASSAWTAATITGNTATVNFDLAALGAAYGAGSLTDVVSGGTAAAPFGTGALPTDRAFLCMKVPGDKLIPQSRYEAVATLTKGDTTEQANASCKAPLAGLGGGIKIDVRNFSNFGANSDWVDYIRIINNSETVAADITLQYIKADGKYGKWVKLAQPLQPRESKFLSHKDIATLMAAGTETNDVNKAPAGQQMLAADEQGRLRVSSEAASTLRVQNYLLNTKTGLLSEVSSSQGADFVNVEASVRDHIDQDAQTGIKK